MRLWIFLRRQGMLQISLWIAEKGPTNPGHRPTFFSMATVCFGPGNSGWYTRHNVILNFWV